MTVFALNRAARLICELAGAKISSPLVDIYPEPVEPFKVHVRFANISRLIGIEIEKTVKMGGNAGSKLKAFVFFKGRSILYKEKGEILLLRLAQELEEVGKVEQLPKLEGKRMTMFMAPKVKKK